MVGLGEDTAGVFSNDADFAKQIVSAADEVNESMWRMPITEHHRESIKP